MNVYVPTVATHWGDWVCGFWASEMLATLDSSVEQVIDPTYYERPDRSRPSNILDWIELPWASSFDRIDVSEASNRFDKVLTTHHRHCHKRSMYEGVHGDKMLFFDAHGISFKCVVGRWYPTFRPTQRLMDAFGRLHLEPGTYNAIHLNEPLSDCRRTLSVPEFLKTNAKELHDWSSGIQLVSTSNHVPHSLDFSSLHGWLKLMVLINAKEVWASHTGFTSIASMYRKRQSVKLINEFGWGLINMGPPPICYSNYDVIAGLQRELAWSIDREDWFDDIRGEDYRIRSENTWRDWRSFEMFEGAELDLEVPANYVEPTVRWDAENCPVEWGTRFVRHRGGLIEMKSFMDPVDLEELTSISRIVLDPKQFEKYH